MSEERSSILPRDEFSIRLRELTDNPGAVRASSTINRIDFYGRTETWVIDTFRHDGVETVFAQRINADEGPALRFIMPPEVTEALARQRGRAVTSVRRRGARQAAATREAKGIKPAFLKARKKR